MMTRCKAIGQGRCLAVTRPLSLASTRKALPYTYFLKTLESRSSTGQSTAPARSVNTLGTGQLLSAYRDLSKFRLTVLVTLTAMASFAIAPTTTLAAAAATTGLGSSSTVSLLAATTIGTALCSAGANSCNQWIETEHDAKMSRTKARVLVRGRISEGHALAFSAATSLSGVSLLAYYVNPLTAFVGGLNILLYTAVYTPMKRKTIVNTWVGSLVGGLPPLMGWAAATGSLADPGAWALAAILFAWQFPHFNSLAWSMRHDYQRAGYRMMSVSHPDLNTRVSLRYSLLLLPLSWSLTVFDVTDQIFLYDSTLVNGFLLVAAYKFWKSCNDKTARRLFFLSLIHLPALMILMMVHKVGEAHEEEVELDD